jgi:hypothetical protein
MKLINNFFANVRKMIAPGIVCMLLFAVVSCNASKEPTISDDIPFTANWLTDCWWTNIDSRVLIINSDEELKKYIEYIECADANYHLDIDFSKHTLLLVSAPTHMWVGKVNVNSFQQLSANKYKLNVEVFLGEATMGNGWTIALITNKLDIQAEIKLNITTIEN